MAWRVANSLLHLRNQVNKAIPNRRKENDGTIGDAAHATRTSDHNPWVRDGATGVVTAMDITHDPGHGFDSYKVADHLRLIKDNRIKYVISNHRIWTPSVSSQWRPYHGTNPHDHHVHISVLSSKAKYDDESDWNWKPSGAVLPTLSPDAPVTMPSNPILMIGANGPAVEQLQRILAIKVDGDFGPLTERAVRDFQSRHGLVVDGRVGYYTWRELLVSRVEEQTGGLITNIVATVFGGRTDLERSAYDGHHITEQECAVALPYRFPGEPRPKVTVINRANGRQVVCTIEDVGPWNINDPYWLHGTRPEAESGIDQRGRKTNRAGIDLSPAAARALGIDGMGRVDWRFS